MASVFRQRRPDGGYYPGWRIRFFDWTGKRRCITYIPESSGENRQHREAQSYADRLEKEHDEIRMGRKPIPTSAEAHQKTPVSEIIEKYLEWGASQGGRRGKPWGSEHARKRGSALKWWRERLGLRVMGDLDGSLSGVETVLQDLQKSGRDNLTGKTKDTRRLAGKTLENYAEALKAFCVWAVDRKYLSCNPLVDLAGFDISPKSTRRALTPDEIRKLLESCAAHRRLLYQVVLASGLRANELRQLTAAHLDVDRGGLHLSESWTKNRKPGFQPIPRQLVDALKEHIASGATEAEYRKHYGDDTPETIPARPLLYVPSHTARDMEKDLKAAGIPRTLPGLGKVDFHSCRNSYITFLFESGASLKEAQELARHSTPTMTANVYARTRRDRLTILSEAVGNGLFPAPNGKKEAKSEGDSDAENS